MPPHLTFRICVDTAFETLGNRSREGWAGSKYAWSPPTSVLDRVEGGAGLPAAGIKTRASDPWRTVVGEDGETCEPCSADGMCATFLKTACCPNVSPFASRPQLEQLEGRGFQATRALSPRQLPLSSERK
jgi:hypothetical protein